MMKRIVFTFLSVVCTLAVFGQKFKVDTLLMNGPIDQRINYVFIGDGYQATELKKFMTDAQALVDDLYSQSPFKEYKAYFNAFAISVPSNESGAALNPNNPIDNYFGSTFGYAGIDRLLVPVKSGRITSVLADNFPAYDQVFVVVNSAKYGGSGGWIATSSTNYSAPEIAIHEIGHSFADLRDEYWAGAHMAREKANMTRESDPTKVRWKNWVGTDGCGVYAYPGQSWYRPHQTCKMQYLNFPFCGVCKEAIVEKVLALTKPILGFSPSRDSAVSLNDAVVFELDLLKPSPNTLTVSWNINDTIDVGKGQKLELKNEDVPLGESKLKVSVFDQTPLSKRNNAINYRFYTLSWDLTKDFSVNIGSPVQQEFDLSIYPNPATNRIQVDTDAKVSRMRIVNLQGKVLLEKNAIYDRSVDVSSLPEGIYVLQVESNGQWLQHKFLKDSGA